MKQQPPPQKISLPQPGWEALVEGLKDR